MAKVRSGKARGNFAATGRPKGCPTVPESRNGGEETGQRCWTSPPPPESRHLSAAPPAGVLIGFFELADVVVTLERPYGPPHSAGSPACGVGERRGHNPRASRARRCTASEGRPRLTTSIVLPKPTKDGDALGWLELPGPSTQPVTAPGLKGWGVGQPVSRLPSVAWLGVRQKPRLWVSQQTLMALRLGSKGSGCRGTGDCASRGHVAPKRPAHSPRSRLPALPCLNLTVPGTLNVGGSPGCSWGSLETLPLWAGVPGSGPHSPVECLGS